MHILINESPINVPSLSENILLGARKIAIQCNVNTSDVIALVVIIASELNLEN